MRVVIADDSALIRDGLAHVLPAHGFEVAAIAEDGPSLLDAVADARPDIALIDIRMPPSYTNEGIDAAHAIRRLHQDVGVIVLSQHIDADYALALIRDDPAKCGYLLKDRITTIDVLADAIHRVAAGDTVVDPDLVHLLLDRPAAKQSIQQLSIREQEVLSLVAQGLTDRGISEALWLTPRTVETHVRHILSKLGLPADQQHNRRVLAVLTYLRTTRTTGPLRGF
jgi:DNA-binding NarL/FixJ family response regulator